NRPRVGDIAVDRERRCVVHIDGSAVDHAPDRGCVEVAVHPESTAIGQHAGDANQVSAELRPGLNNPGVVHIAIDLERQTILLHTSAVDESACGDAANVINRSVVGQSGRGDAGDASNPSVIDQCARSDAAAVRTIIFANKSVVDQSARGDGAAAGEVQVAGLAYRQPIGDGEGLCNATVRKLGAIIAALAVAVVLSAQCERVDGGACVQSHGVAAAAVNHDIASRAGFACAPV